MCTLNHPSTHKVKVARILLAHNNDYTFTKGASSFSWIQMGKITQRVNSKRGELSELSGFVVNFGNVLLVLCVCPCTFISGLQGTHHQFVTVPLVLL